MTKELIEKLGLNTHPEGGYFREMYRSGNMITIPEEGRQRSAVTTIYYLLEREQISRFHKITPDEIWHFYQGDPLELYIYNEITEVLTKSILNEDNRICVVPGGCWQAARTVGSYSLLGCTVAPAFEFEDFYFMQDERLIQKITLAYPDLAGLI